MRKTSENKITTTELVRRRKILEQRRDHLTLMKRKSRLEPVTKEQGQVDYEGVENLCEEITNLGRYPVLDPSKCKVTFPTEMVVLNKETSLMIMLRDVNGDMFDDRNNEVDVFMVTKTEAIVLGPVKNVSGGNNTVSFTPRTLGDHVISVTVDGQHIADSPYK